MALLQKWAVTEKDELGNLIETGTIEITSGAGNDLAADIVFKGRIVKTGFTDSDELIFTIKLGSHVN